MNLWRSRSLPNFSAYLEQTAPRFRKERLDIAICFASGVLSGALFYLLLEQWGPFVAVPLAVLVGVPAITQLVLAFLRWLRRPKSRDEQRLEKASRLILQLHAHLARGRLRRSLDPIVASLLEECARHWQRVHKELKSGFWATENLPAHWVAARDRALAASDAAMTDVLLLLEPYLAPPPKSGGLAGAIEAIAEVFFEPELPSPMGPLPSQFESARNIAENLKLLAAELEQAGKEVAVHEAVEGEYPSTRSMLACLEELRMIRQAESELQRHLHQD